MIESLEGKTWEIVAAGAVGISVYFFQKYNSQIESKIDHAINRFDMMLSSHENKQDEIRNILIAQKDNMIREIGEINRQMIIIEKSLYENKDIVRGDLNEFKQSFMNTLRKFEVFQSTIKVATTKIQKEVGRVDHIEGELKTLYGKVKVIDSGFKTSSVEIQEDMKNIKRILVGHKKRLDGGDK